MIMRSRGHIGEKLEENFLTFIRNHKSIERALLKVLRQHLQYEEIVSIADGDLELVQQRQIYFGESHSLEGRITSISEPYARPIVHDKAKGK